MKIAIYLRVSTGAQDLEPQRKELGEYCAAKGWEVGGEFSDVMSGARRERAGLEAMMAAVRGGGFEAVMVVKLDRLARSLVHFAQVAGELDKLGVALVVPGQGIDTSKSNPCGRFQMNVLAAVAELEREFIRERTVAGLAVARANGRVLGRPSKVLVADWKPVVESWRAETGGVGLRDLAKRLGGVALATAARLSRECPTSEAPAEKSAGSRA